VNNELRIMRKEVVVAQFEVPSRHSSAGTNENDETSQSGQVQSVPLIVRHHFYLSAVFHLSDCDECDGVCCHPRCIYIF
jgi:hypothetical protein